MYVLRTTPGIKKTLRAFSSVTTYVTVCCTYQIAECNKLYFGHMHFPINVSNSLNITIITVPPTMLELVEVECTV